MNNFLYSNKTLLRQVADFIKEQRLVEKGDRVLLSLSAGKDSMALFNIMRELEAEFDIGIGVFHLNHLRRGKESDDDETFLRRLTLTHHVAFHLERFDFDKNKEKGRSFEEQAREVRYGLLEKTAVDHGYARIATGHTQSDHVETLLMRIFCGTGLYGLSGISARRGSIIRPILSLRSSDVLEYLTHEGVEWREDSTNAENGPNRNYIRNKVLPAVLEKFPMAEASLSSLAVQARENEELISRLTGPLMESVAHNGTVEVKLTGNMIFFPFFAHVLAAILREHFRYYVREAVIREIWKNLAGKKANILLYRNKDFEIRKKYRESAGVLWIGPRHDPSPDPLWSFDLSLPFSDREEIFLEAISLRVCISIVDYKFFVEHRNDASFVFISLPERAEAVCFRSRRHGDRIRLEGGTRKIKDLFIENKMDRDVKNAVPLLVIDGDISAVLAGFVSPASSRVAEKFQVKVETKKILAIQKKSL